MRRRPLPALAAGALALALGLTACADDDPTAASGSPGQTAAPSAPAPAEGAASGSAVELVSAAPEAARQAGTARIRLESVSTTPQGEVRLTGEGVVDNADGSAQLTLTPELPAGVEGGEAAAVGPIETRIVDGSVYVRGIPGQEGTWLRQPVAEAAAAGGLSPSDPTQALQMLASVGDVQEAGSQTVNGVETTRYTGAIQVAELLEAPAADSSQVAQSLEQLQAAGVTQIPFEVYLDEQGRPARMVQSIELTVSGTTVSTRTTTDLTDWGVEVDVQAPPAAEVVDVPAGPTGS